VLYGSAYFLNGEDIDFTITIVIWLYASQELGTNNSIATVKCIRKMFQYSSVVNANKNSYIVPITMNNNN